MYALRGTVQPYAWGMIGSSSLVAQLASKSSSINSTQPYAEYWMGTHPKGESYLVDNKQTSLKAYLNCDLPFLFKILSVKTALSIQAHPNKEHAKILHQQNPKEYPDDNHKPEMAIALTKFECLCAFRPYKQINDFIQKYEQLQILCGKQVCEQFASAISSNAESSIQQSLLKQIYSNLMQSSPAIISQCVDAHLKFISSTTDSNVELSRLFERLNQQYPGGDVGLFSIYFFNYIILNPGEAILLKANIPHAYLHGECVECMACSDNVVRAGLTPKFKDIPTLIDMLDYQPLTIEQTKFSGKKISENITQFDPKQVSNIDDFIVQEIKGKNGVIDAIDKPSLMVIVQGQGTMNEGKIQFNQADVFLIDKQTSIDFKSDKDLLAYRAYSLIQ
jgi:mannose-6-phosphate isomerase